MLKEEIRMEDDLNIRRISTGLYYIVDSIIGSEEMIRIRRMVSDIYSVLYNIEIEDEISCHLNMLSSGSKAEGFRFSSSDNDTMVVYKKITVGMGDVSGHLEREDLRMETDQSRPGFCYLRLVSKLQLDVDINQMLVQYQNEYYLSSLFWKDTVTQLIPDSTTHGPCESGMIFDQETDVAHCLKCPGWPKLAYSCLQKLVRLKWPSIHVLSSIVNAGCHMLPIGDKLSDREIIEWRISFSEAEKSLIYEMNHCQFLTYGLLKMFLKEVINTRQEIHGLLCSYFLKTVVFWEIVNNGINLMEYDFLKWFWICFRLLLSWVSHGSCPNFFIPENNMFLGKIYGRSQQVILRHLTSLYQMGYKCLLCCSFKSDYASLIADPMVVVLSFYDKAKQDLHLIREIFQHIHNSPAYIPGLLRCSLYLLDSLRKTETFTRRVVLSIFMQRCTQRFLSSASQMILLSVPISCNRMVYKSVVKHINSFNGTKYDVSSHSILSAILSYKYGMYHHAARKVKIILKRIKGPNVMYLWNLCPYQYMQLGGDLTPVDVMVKAFLVNDIRLGVDTCLPELYLEHKCIKCPIPYLPSVLLNFILFLCYHHLSMQHESYGALEELIFLNNNGDIHRIFKPISWEILGICQEMSGYLDDAYLSYHKALRDPSFSLFQKVTLLRMQTLYDKMNNI